MLRSMKPKKMRKYLFGLESAVMLSLFSELRMKQSAMKMQKASRPYSFVKKVWVQ